MSEKCRLALVQAELNEEVTSGDDIPQTCWQCIARILQKPAVQAQLSWLKLGEISLEANEDRYLIGLINGNGKLRSLTVETIDAEDHWDKVNISFMCDFTSPGRLFERIEPKVEYL